MKVSASTCPAQSVEVQASRLILPRRHNQPIGDGDHTSLCESTQFRQVQVKQAFSPNSLKHIILFNLGHIRPPVPRLQGLARHLPKYL